MYRIVFLSYHGKSDFSLSYEFKFSISLRFRITRVMGKIKVPGHSFIFIINFFVSNPLRTLQSCENIDRNYHFHGIRILCFWSWRTCFLSLKKDRTVFCRFVLISKLIQREIDRSGPRNSVFDKSNVTETRLSIILSPLKSNCSP